MTKSSVSRIAKRVEKFDPPPFALPPAGMLAEQIDLIDYRLVMGLLHPEDSPLLVVVWDGERFRRFLPEQAVRWADDLEASPHAAEFGPVIEALRKLVRRACDISVAALEHQETVH